MLNTNVSVAATKNVEFFVSHKMMLRDGVHQGAHDVALRELPRRVVRPQDGRNDATRWRPARG